MAANGVREFAADGLTLLRTPAFDSLLSHAVTDVVARQIDTGVSIVGDGEFGKASADSTDFGPWWSYSFQRFAGLAVRPVNAWNKPELESRPGEVRLTSFRERRDRKAFPQFYAELNTGPIARNAPSVVGRLTYVGHDQVAVDIANLRSALTASAASEGFLTSIAPGVAARLVNDYYASEEEHLWAWAEALREEYVAIIDAGLVLQIDDPSMAENWDAITPEPSVGDYLAYTRQRVDALNWALRDLPAERIRFHLCWGSWHGPHTTDLEFRHIVKLMLEVNAGAYSFEAGNARHEHEWRIWDEVRLPDDKTILPGVVSHATNVVEHPDLIAERLLRFADLVGAERVAASTDCGLGGRIHPEIAWAKLGALVTGAARASGSR
ncbi:cobalamin-independent methionine synthase II family protein [Microbacterium deminutum]